MNRHATVASAIMLISAVCAGCVSNVYNPGPPDSPLHSLKLGENYADMERVLGKPDHSHSEDLAGEETAILFVPVWNIVESIGDFHPSSLEVYAYDRYGTVTIDNKGRIIKIESASSQ